MIFFQTEEIPSSDFSPNEDYKTSAVKAEYEGPEDDFANFGTHGGAAQQSGLAPMNSDFQDPRHHYQGKFISMDGKQVKTRDPWTAPDRLRFLFWVC